MYSSLSSRVRPLPPSPGSRREPPPPLSPEDLWLPAGRNKSGSSLSKRVCKPLRRARRPKHARWKIPGQPKAAPLAEVWVAHLRFTTQPRRSPSCRIHFRRKQEGWVTLGNRHTSPNISLSIYYAPGLSLSFEDTGL